MTGKSTGRREEVRQAIIDVFMAMMIVVSVFIAMFGFTGSWPPIVVVESWSMQHSDYESYIGVIDTGDLVMMKAVESPQDITTYLQGKAAGYMTYSDYGDVIIYQKQNDPSATPIIHRAVMYVEANADGSFRSADLESYAQNVDYVFSKSGDSWNHITGDVVLIDYGFDHKNLEIPLGDLVGSSDSAHAGFITNGDHNPQVDLNLLGQLTSEPISIDRILGKACGEVPWFGVMKLYFTNNLPSETPSNSISCFGVAVFLIFAVPIGLEVYLWRMSAKESDNHREEEELDKGKVE